MFHMQERQLLLSPLFKKPVHNAIRRFSCYQFFRLFRRFSGPISFHPLFKNYAYLFYMVLRCACGFGVIFPLFFINFFHFFDLVFFQVN